jgi:hypothetical protein
MQKDRLTKKYEVPNLYDISGSAHFYNKTHNGITIYRDDDVVDVHVQKVKQSWLGQKGFCSYRFNPYTRQYSFLLGELATKQKSETAEPKKIINGEYEQARLYYLSSDDRKEAEEEDPF